MEINKDLRYSRSNCSVPQQDVTSYYNFYQTRHKPLWGDSFMWNHDKKWESWATIMQIPCPTRTSKKGYTTTKWATKKSNYQCANGGHAWNINTAHPPMRKWTDDWEDWMRRAWISQKEENTLSFLRLTLDKEWRFQLLGTIGWIWTWAYFETQ